MPTITVPQARGYAVAAGFTGLAVETVVAIAQAESSLVTDVRNVNNDSHQYPDGTHASTDRGVLQINDWWFEHAPDANPVVTDAMADDPAQAFKAAYAISAKGTNFDLWSTFKSGAYKAHLIPRNPAPLSQLHEPTKDGKPDENTNNNCGETGFAWIGRDIGTESDCDGDEIHDEVIGQGVIGGSDLLSGNSLNPKYVAAAAKRGVTLTLYRGTQAELVAKCHAVMSLAAGDVLANFGGGANYLHQFSDPAHYSGYGHICAIAHYTAGGLELMDPWIGGYRTYSDADLEKMIVWGYIVVATPAVETATAPTPEVKPTPFYGLVYTSDPAVWRCLTTGHSIGGGFLTFYQKVSGPFGESGTQILGLPLSDEYTGTDGKTRQDFERARLVYDPKAANDSVWRVFLDQVGREALTLSHQVSDLDNQLATAQGQVKADSAIIGQQQTQIATLQARVAALQAQIAQMEQQQPAPAAQPAQPATPAATPTTSTTPTTPAAAASLLVQLIWSEAEAALKATGA